MSTLHRPPIKGKFLRNQNESVPTGRDFAESIGGVAGLVSELTYLKNEVINSVNEKIDEVDSKLKDIVDTTKILESTKSEVISIVKEIHQGPPGKPANEENIYNKLLSKFPDPIDVDALAKNILSRVPKIDEKNLTKKILKAIPENKASLKVIQEKFEIDPMSVIEKIMELPDGKFKLKTNNIDGLEQTMSAFRSQLGRGYLHGGGDTVTAGTNITITTNAAGQKVISASGSASPLTTKGDLYTYTTVNARLAVGSDGQILFADSAQTTGLRWGLGTGIYTFSSGLTLTGSTVTNNLITGIAGGQTAIGGTGTNDSLTLQSTTAVGATGANIVFKVGNNGSTTAMTILNNGQVGIGISPSFPLQVFTSVATMDNITIGSFEVKDTVTNRISELRLTGSPTTNRQFAIQAYENSNLLSQVVLTNETGSSGGVRLLYGSTIGLWLNTNGLVTIGNTTPTHSLTLPSTSTGIAIYHTTDQTINYERLRIFDSSGVMTILTERGGTGTSRPLQLQQNTGGSVYTIQIDKNSNSSSVGAVSFSAGASNYITAFNFGTTGSSASSGIQGIVLINPTITQTSTAGYTALIINPTESTTGSGIKLLVDFQLGGSSKFNIANDGTITSSNLAGTGTRTVVASSTGVLSTQTIPTNPTFTVTTVTTTGAVTSGITRVNSSGTTTQTLPTAVGITGQQFIIKNINTGVVTIATTSAQTIDGAATQSLLTQYSSLTIVSNGTNWDII